jgi:glycosyltransferase involved in cell wall biosynthesis
MKILNAIHAQSIGGVDQMFRNYTKALLNLNHEVSLLISNNSNQNYNYKGLKTIFKLKNHAQIFDFLHLWFILLIFRPKIVICHSSRTMKWMKILGKITFCKSIAVNHGISFKSSLNCDFAININEQINQMVVKSGFLCKKSFIVKNVIDVEDDFYERKFNYQKPKIGIYGRFEWRKGFDVLIESCAKLTQDFSLKIGGFSVNDYNLDTIKNLAKSLGIYEKCDFVGVVKDKKEFFKDVDIFVVPSREEPFGLVILEGFANSCLVISSNSEGGKMLIKNNEDGLLFENENRQDLAQKIEYAIKNHEKYCNFTKKAYKKLIEEYNFQVFENEIAKILKTTS